jgi:CBS domain-containing protein
MKTIEEFVRKVVTTAPSALLASIARTMEEHKVGALVVVEEDRPVGMLTDRDLALQVVARGVSPQTPVAKVMSAPVMTAPRDDGIFDMTQAMMDAKVRRLPVVDVLAGKGTHRL